MNLTYYGFRPFKITPGKVVVLATGSPHIYQEIILGLQDRTDTVKLSDDNFTTVTVGEGRTVVWRSPVKRGFKCVISTKTANEVVESLS